MSYKRIYPKKCNTLFKNLNGFADGVTGNVNTSQNPVLELRDGASKSILLFNFDITDIVDKLNNFTYDVSLNLFDGGLFYEPGIKLKYIDLFYFDHDWAEGDGYGFEQGNAKVGVSNYNYYDSSNLWTNEFTNNASLRVYHLQSQHEDLILTVNSFIAYALTHNKTQFTLGIKITDEVRSEGTIQLMSGTPGDIITSIKVNNIDILDGNDITFVDLATTTAEIISKIDNNQFGYNAYEDLSIPHLIHIVAPANSGSTYNGFTFNILYSGGSTIVINQMPFINGITGHEDGIDVYTKYINSHFTRTVFKPYLEIKVNDETKDLRTLSYPGDSLILYFQSSSGRPIGGGTLQCKIYDDTNTLLLTLTPTDQGDGLYAATWSVPNNVVGGIYSEVWNYNGTDIWRNIIQIKSLLEAQNSNPYYNNLFFGPSGIPYTVQKGDKIKANYFAEIRHLNNVLDPGFQYKVIQSNGFEMIPWTDVNILNSEMFFIIDTDFFFPDIEYTVLGRLNQGDSSITSDLKAKFKVIDKDRNRLDSFNASPYNSRDYYLRKP